MQEARKSLGEYWSKAEEISGLDPGIQRRMVDGILSGKIKAIDGEQVGLLTKETIDAVAERNAAADAVNSAKTPEELDFAKSRRVLVAGGTASKRCRRRQENRDINRPRDYRLARWRQEPTDLTRMESRLVVWHTVAS